MIDIKKKCWREKVTAEITLAHVQQIAAETGSLMSAAEVAAFLNEKGRAQNMWIHMMQAGEAFIKASLATKPPRVVPVKHSTMRPTVVH